MRRSPPARMRPATPLTQKAWQTAPSYSSCPRGYRLLLSDPRRSLEKKTHGDTCLPALATGAGRGDPPTIRTQDCQTPMPPPSPRRVRDTLTSGTERKEGAVAKKSSVSTAMVANAKLLRFTPRVTTRMCEKCGHVGQLWQWWKLSFCRVCRCFSVRYG